MKTASPRLKQDGELLEFHEQVPAPGVTRPPGQQARGHKDLRGRNSGLIALGHEALEEPVEADSMRAERGDGGSGR